MSFFTARQLEDLHKTSGSNGQLVLPYRARLTPLASDWVRARKIVLGYSDDSAASPFRGRSENDVSSAPNAEDAKQENTTRLGAGSSTGAILWWCDGPCGPAKAAVIAQSKESVLLPIDLPADARQVVPAIKHLAGEIRTGRAGAGVLLVESAASAIVFANRCSSLRAIVGTCMETVEQGIRLIGANVLIIEHAHRTLHQVKSMLARFARAKHELPEDVKRQLQELSNCG